jgi:rhombotail lipoprotein
LRESAAIAEIAVSFTSHGRAMKTRAALLLALSVSILSGCMFLHHGRDVRNASSLVDFLYPGGAAPLESTMPVLRTPLRVGLAFLPENKGQEAALPAAQKAELLEKIRTRFRDRKFVSEIVVIPDYYLKTAQGFSGLAGVQRLYSIDLMALVSYDQVSHLDNNRLSLSYLTIVGAYVVKGSSHDVTTLVDLAVVDPATRSLVLRAGGTDTRHGNSTLVEEQRDARTASAKSFTAATEQLIDNFDATLATFEADVRAGKANVRVAQRESGSGQGSVKSGGGSFSWADLLFLLLLAGGSLSLEYRRRCGQDAG